MPAGPEACHFCATGTAPSFHALGEEREFLPEMNALPAPARTPKAHEREFLAISF
ncbi:MAG: hypothetical protein KME26_21350 [Oscillatoria princeps RMCB-10]|jgi:hypothetical protein|nr:hypothetical protein [Oscillatoria princeps RMCB-10]